MRNTKQRRQSNMLLFFCPLKIIKVPHHKLRKYGSMVASKDTNWFPHDEFVQRFISIFYVGRCNAQCGSPLLISNAVFMLVTSKNTCLLRCQLQVCLYCLPNAYMLLEYACSCLVCSISAPIRLTTLLQLLVNIKINVLILCKLNSILA